MANQPIEELGELDAVTLEHLDVVVKIVLGSVGLLRLDPLELSRNLVDLGLGGGSRGHLHRGNRLHPTRQKVKRVRKKSFRKYLLTPHTFLVNCLQIG